MPDLTRRVIASAAALATAVVLAGCGASGSSDGAVVSGLSQQDSDGMNGAVLTTPYHWPERTLTDSDGRPFDTRKNLRAPLTLVFFGYTKCPDICQAVMADITSALSRLDPEDAAKVAMWFVTTDPTRDDPGTLREYLHRFDPAFEGLTGPMGDILSVARPVHVPVEQGRKLPSGGYEVVHGTSILGVLPDGSVPIVWTEGTSAARLAADFHTILTTGIPKEDQSS